MLIMMKNTYYFSTHGCTLVFSPSFFSVSLVAAPLARAAFRALRSKKLAIVVDIEYVD